MKIFNLLLFFTFGCAAFNKGSPIIQKRLQSIISSKEYSLTIYMKGFVNNKEVKSESIDSETKNFINANCTQSGLKTDSRFKNEIAIARTTCDILNAFKSNSITKNIRLITADEKIEGTHFSILVNANTYENKPLTYIGFFTLFLIPFKIENTIEYNVTIFDEGKIQGSYFFSMSNYVWHHLLLLPLTPFLNGYNKTYLNTNNEFIAALLRDTAKTN